MPSDCNCEQALALRAEVNELKRQVKWLEDRNSADGTDGVIAELDRSNAALRDLAGEAAAIIRARGDDEEQDEEGEAWLARAAALGVPCR